MYAICKVLPALCRKDLKPKPHPNSGTATKRIMGYVSINRKRKRSETKKALLVMKLTAFILLVCCLEVSAKVSSQTISFTAKEVKLEKVFTAIKQQTGYTVVVNARLIKSLPPVSVEARNEPLTDFLTGLLTPQSLDFSIENKTIVISRAKRVEIFTEPVTPEVEYIEVHGRVVDEKGQPMVGVTILVKGGRGATTTDAKGNFMLKRVQDDAVLQITYIGYLAKEINARVVMGTIQMEVSNNKLDEVQVQGYGLTSHRLSTATIGTIKSSDIAKQPVSDPLLALQGRIPGLLITPTSGNFGDKVNVQIRGGKNSISFQSNPLFIVDNVPVSNDNFLLPGAITSFSPFSFLNPSDIESIDVLKDADATAIYGSRGANGVILITTKKGKLGKPTIEIDGQYGYGEVAKHLNLLGTEDYIAMRKEAYANSGLNYTSGGITSANADLRLYDQSKYTDWQKIMIGGKGIYQNYQGAISGGEPTIQYLVSGNFHRETTVYPGTNYSQKGNLHFSLTGNSLDQKFKISLTGSYLVNGMNTSSYDYTPNIYFAPNSPDLLNPDGSINWAINPDNGISTWRLNGNPYAKDLQRSKTSVSNINSGINLNYELIPRFNVKLTGGYSKLNGSNIFIVPGASWEPANQDISILNYARYATFTNNTAESWNFEPQLQYTFNIEKNKFDLLLGGTLQNTVNNSSGLQLSGYSNDALLLNQAAATNVDSKSNNSVQYKYSALFFRANYNLSDKYIVNINGRRDGSSRFGPGNQFGNFGSVAGAWIFSNEKFVQESIPWLSFGKAKISYGITGNDGIDNYQYFESYQLTQSAVTYQNSLGYTSNGAINSDFHWESVKKAEFDLELGLFKDRILLQASYFRNVTGNQLVYYPTPAFAGYGGIYVNLPAKLENKGIELSLNTININSGKFKWSSSINFTSTRNKLLSFPDLDKSSYFLSEIGQPIANVDKVAKFADVNSTTGGFEFYDADGNLTTNPPFDERVIKSPKFYGGIANTLNYKDFSLDFFIQFTKQIGINPLFQANPAGLSRINTLQEIYDDRWVPGKTNAIFAKIGTTLPPYYGTAQASTIGYSDASFIRLKNVSFSYNLPDDISRKCGLKKVRFYLQGQNLLTITGYKGLDPETQSMMSLPPLRVWTAGLQLSL